MKKTLIALAAVAVTGTSFAQATIGGVVDLGYSTAKAKVAGATAAELKGMSQGVQNGGRIFFKSNEDLGGGLSIAANLEFSISPAQADQSFASRQTFLTLAGGFGSVSLGRQYSLLHNNQGAGDLVGNITHAGYLGGTDSPVRVSNTFIYTTPTFNGVTASVEAITDPSVAAPGAAKTTGNGFRLGYAAGPLAIAFVRETTKNLDSDLSLLGGSVVDATLALVGVDKKKANNLSVTYDLGVAKVGLVNNSTKYDTLKWSANTLSVAVPMGSTTLLASVGNGKFSDTGFSVKMSAYQLGAKYDLSKRTNLYVFTGQTKAKIVDVKFSQTSVGVKHAF